MFPARRLVCWANYSLKLIYDPMAENKYFVSIWFVKPCGLKLPKSKIFLLDVRWFFATLSVFSTMDLNDVNKWKYNDILQLWSRHLVELAGWSWRCSTLHTHLSLGTAGQPVTTYYYVCISMNCTFALNTFSQRIMLLSIILAFLFIVIYLYSAKIIHLYWVLLINRIV